MTAGQGHFLGLPRMPLPAGFLFLSASFSACRESTSSISLVA